MSSKRRAANSKIFTDQVSAVILSAEDSPFNRVHSLNPAPEPSEPVIVLVDDEKPFTDLMGTLLEHGLGVRTIVFNDPVTALAGMAEHRPTLVVSDYRMPHLDGFEFLKEVAVRFPGLPSILVTGNQLDDATIAERKPAALLSVLFKPLSWRDIAGVMRRNALLP